MPRFVCLFLKFSLYFVFFVGIGLVCILVCFCVSLDHFGVCVVV